jgi:hypothetical protein
MLRAIAIQPKFPSRESGALLIFFAERSKANRKSTVFFA